MDRNKYVELVANNANVSYNDARARMRYARGKYGISYRDFCNNNLYYKNEIRLEKFSKRKEERIKTREENYKLIEEASSLSREQIQELISYYKLETGYSLYVKQFYDYRLYELDREQGKALVSKIRDRDYLRKKLKPIIKSLYLEGENLESIKPQLDMVKKLIGETISFAARDEIIEKINDSHFDISAYSEAQLNDLICDIQYMNFIFNYSYIEYFMFGFTDKSLEERLEFLAIAEKRSYAERVCDPFESDLLDSKWLAYKKLEPAYKRSACVLENESSYSEFKKFCKENRKFIAKPLTELKGEGIELIDLDKKKFLSRKKVFDSLLEKDSYIAEQLIKQNEDFGKFNPDSVNTVRIISYYDKNEVHLKWTFIRVGRKGSAVDNAGAGGVFAAIDTETGVIYTDACDENGLKYAKHPDSGVQFIGFEIPKWKELLELCRNTALKLPGVRYIGWDFAYTTDDEWVLVEANIQPGCRAIQAATNRGIRREFLDMFIQGEGVIEKKNSNVISVAQKAEITYDEALKMMDEAKEKYGIPYPYFDRKNLHLANDIRMEKYGEVCRKNEELKDEHYQNIYEAVGLDKDAIDELVNEIRTICDYRITVAMLDVYDLCLLDEAGLYSAVYKLKRRNALISALKKKIERIDRGRASYDDLQKDIEELRENLRGLLSKTVIEKTKEPVLEAFPGREFSEGEMLDLITDIRLTHLILEFNTAEYLTYHFENKSIEERHKFIANPERLYWTKIVNDKKTSETLDDKYQSYLRFKDHYNRNVLLMETDDCFDEFCEFCKKTPVFVKKPLTESQGKGVGLVKTDSSTDLKALFRELREDSDRMVLEEVIEQSEITSVFNTDSVNTLRLITFNNNNDVRLMFSFFRTGRRGSFVDNAGSGGVFASVDVKTGILESVGGDELGRRFECHPESNVKYKGFQLPDWDKAVELAKTLARAIPEMTYVGWDFAYDKNNNWVIVEYNSHPEFVQQGPADHGCRAEFLETIDIYKANKKSNKKPKKKRSKLQRAVRKIKRVVKKSISKIRNFATTCLIYVLRAVLAVMYAPFKLLPTDENKILFLSRQSDEVNLDFKLLQDYLEKEKPDAKIVNICKRCDSGIKDYVVFVWYIMKSLYHIATAKVCVLDSYWPAISMLKHKKSLYVIQLWHAMGKIKKSGYQSLGKIGGRDERVARAMAMHKNYDAVIAGGQEWNPFYCQSFGIEEKVLVNCGLPRTDYLIASEQENREKILNAYPQFKEKRVLLYAPTFRRGWKAHWNKLLMCIDLDKYILIVKSHPNQKLETNDSVYTCKEFSAVELLSVCDYLITDYSAIAVEGAILNRKTLYYVYDYEKYDKNNGLNINLFDIMPGCVFKNAEELAGALETEYPQELLDSYRQKFLPSSLGTSTKTIGRLIIEKTEK